MSYKTNDNTLINFLIPAYLGGDFAIYKNLSKKYDKVRPYAIKLLLYMYVKHNLLNSKKSITYEDLVDRSISANYYWQSIKELSRVGLVVHLGFKKGYVMTDKGKECIKDYYSFMSVYIDELESKFNIKTISDNIVSESSGFYSQ